MDEDHRQRLLEWFGQAVELEPSERARFCEERRLEDAALHAELLSLLEHYETTGSFHVATELLGAALGGAVPEQDAHLPQDLRIGGYRIESVLGRGGMGVVYLAEQQEPVRRRVALKVVREGFASERALARFRAERQALARMDHSGIARIFEAGSTEDGRPYFAMEAVEGRTLTAHCDACRSSVRERLELFAEVCDAVAHAHQKGVIHRDLKPSNILVALEDSRARPKVIDFGIARGVTERLAPEETLTLQGEFLGTLQYMSPEQATPGAEDLDTRTDIYSLGVVLYELLCGSLPFTREGSQGNTSLLELLRDLREREPVTPSTRLFEQDERESVAERRGTTALRLRHLLSGELDWITSRALEKDRERRFGSASEFAAEVRRFLNDEPVLSGPPSTSYRMRKFVRRHRVAVAVSAVIFFLLLVGITGTTFSLYWALDEQARAEAALLREREERRRAESAERQTAQVARFEARKLRDVDAVKMGLRLRAGLLESLREELARDGLEPTALDARLEELATALAEADFTDLARTALRQDVLDPARAAVDEQFSDQPLVRAQLLASLSQTLWALGFQAEAREPIAVACELLETHVGEADPRTLEARIDLAFVNLNAETPGAAEQRLLHTLAQCEELLGARHEHTLHAHRVLSVHFHAGRRFAEARTHMQVLLEASRREHGEHHASTLLCRSSLARLDYEEGRLQRAEREMRDILAALGQRVAETSWSFLSQESLLGEILLARGEHEEALPIFERVVEGARTLHGKDHPNTLAIELETVAALTAADEDEAALERLRSIVERSHRALGEDHPRTIESMAVLADLLVSMGELIEAEEWSTRAEQAGDEASAARPKVRLALWRARAHLLLAHGSVELAIEPLRNLRDELEQNEPWNVRAWVLATLELGSALRESRPEEALALFEQALERAREELGNEHLDTVTAGAFRGSALRHLGRLDEAEEALERAHERTVALVGAEDLRSLGLLEERAALREAQGRLPDALELYEANLAGRSRVRGEDDLETLRRRFRLADLLASHGEWERARAHLVRTLEGLERVLGDAEETSEVLSRLTTLHGSVERWEDAAAWARRWIEMRLRFRGEDDVGTLVASQRFGWRLQEKNALAEAEWFFRRAVEGLASIPGQEDNERIATSSLVRNLLRQGRPEDADAPSEAALARARSLHGEAHEGTRRGLELRAEVLEKQGKLADAEPLLWELVMLNRKLSGEAHRSTGVALNDYGLNLFRQKKHVEAAKAFREAYDVLRHVTGEEENAYVSIKNSALAHDRSQDVTSALEGHREIVAWCRRAFGPEDARTDGHQVELGRRLLEARDYEGAASELAACHERRTKLPREGDEARERHLVGLWLGRAHLHRAGQLGSANLEAARERLALAEKVLVPAAEWFWSTKAEGYESAVRTMVDFHRIAQRATPSEETKRREELWRERMR